MLASTNRLLAGAIGAFVAVSALTVTATSAPRYDGMWSVSIVTQKGDCDRGYRYPIRIANGTVVNGGSDPFTISGKVAPSGAITVTVSSGSKSPPAPATSPATAAKAPGTAAPAPASGPRNAATRNARASLRIAAQAAARSGLTQHPASRLRAAPTADRLPAVPAHRLQRFAASVPTEL
jgi:hypothetical protein